MWVQAGTFGLSCGSSRFPYDDKPAQKGTNKVCQVCRRGAKTIEFVIRRVLRMFNRFANITIKILTSVETWCYLYLVFNLARILTEYGVSRERMTYTGTVSYEARYRFDERGLLEQRKVNLYQWQLFLEFWTYWTRWVESAIGDLIFHMVYSMDVIFGGGYDRAYAGWGDVWFLRYLDDIFLHPTFSMGFE